MTEIEANTNNYIENSSNSYSDYDEGNGSESSGDFGIDHDS